MKKWMKLENIFDIEEWEIVQDSLASVTGMAIITVDYKGVPVTKHSCCHAFCQSIRNDKELSEYCQKCDARGGLEAVRNNEAYIYRCHLGIVDIAIPIIVNDKYIGAIMAGQVRVANGREGDLEQIFIPADKTVLDEAKERLAKEYHALPFLSKERIKMIADMLFYLCNYMVKESIHKMEIINMYEAVYQNQNVDFLEGDEKEQLKSAKRIKDAMSEVILEANIKKKVKSDTSTKEKEERVHHNSIITQAFNYIYTHKSESPSLTQLAEHCHVSPSYLSRLFSKEVGESYSMFVTKLKVEWAKAILESSDTTVQEISEGLGFNEAGYFIKVFKKYVGVTPALYRSYCKTQ